MKPREQMLLRRLLLNENYNDFLIAETILIGIDRDLLKTLSRHPNATIASNAMSLRIDCMNFFSSRCYTYKKMYEDLIEQTMIACQGPKPEEDSPFTILDPVLLLPYWRAAYCRAKAMAPECTRAVERLKAKRYFQEKENINEHNIKFYFTQYLNYITYWIATRHDSEEFLLLDLKNRLIDLSNQLNADSMDSKFIPKKRTTEYYTDDGYGEGIYEI